MAADSGDAEDLDAFFCQLLDELCLSEEDKDTLSAAYAEGNIRKKLDLVNQLQQLQDEALDESAGGSADDHRQGAEEEPSQQGGLGASHDEEVNLPAVDAAWRRLLAETLPEEKQRVLQQSYDAEPSALRKYHMLLEFSSYLRRPEPASVPSSDGKEASGLRRRFGGGGRGDDMSRDDGPYYGDEDKYGRHRRRRQEESLWPLAMTVAVILGLVLTFVYFFRKPLVGVEDDVY